MTTLQKIYEISDLIFVVSMAFVFWAFCAVVTALILFKLVCPAYLTFKRDNRKYKQQKKGVFSISPGEGLNDKM